MGRLLMSKLIISVLFLHNWLFLFVQIFFITLDFWHPTFDIIAKISWNNLNNWKWGRRYSFARLLISQILKGSTYCALYDGLAYTNQTSSESFWPKDITTDITKCLIHHRKKNLGGEVATRKVYARPKSLCAYIQNWPFNQFKTMQQKESF